MTVAAVLVARVSTTGLVGAGLALIALVAYAAFRWPHPAIVLVVLSPILDRYLVAGLLPVEVAPLANYFSEALLLSVTLALLIRAAREGRLVAAFRHPVTALLGAFSLLAVLSTLVNAVPPHVAVLGLVFTLDAATLFFLPRLVPWTRRQMVMAVGAFVAIVVAAALVALAQAILRPDLLGLYVMTGQFGELYRLAAFIGDPNVLGAFINAAAPFALLAATNLESQRHRRIAVGIAFLLMLILWLTFSRGAWLAMAVSTVFVLAWYGRRTLVLAVAILAVSFLTANFMPRDLILNGEGGVRPNVIGSTFGRVGAVGEGRDLRIKFVQNAVPIIADHPLIGVGPGRWGGAVAYDFRSPVYQEYGTDEVFNLYPQRTVDNFWLHLLVESGFLGVAAFVAAAAVPGGRILAAGRRAAGLDRVLLGGIATATVALAVSSVTTMLLEANSVGFLFWFLLGLGSIAAAWVTPGQTAPAVAGEDPA
ncbi:MAG: O-antigen ligase family protein [Candidatus Limnocylindria bacterium]